ncbi:MAG: ZIP family metal transporter [Nanoarchaeota archaeon]
MKHTYVMNITYALFSVVIVSLVSVIFAIPFLIKKKVSDKSLLFLLSVSVGVLLSTVFMDFFPEIVEHGYDLNAALYILLGFLLMFVLEKFVHWHHEKKCEDGDCGHGHAYNLAPVNLIGDGIHNFIDGLVIAGAYSVNLTLGIAATISIIFHEIPQEIADFGVLLYSGMSKKKALIFNFLSAATAIIGTIAGIILIDRVDGFTHVILPFAAGNFLYIAASNLLPQLHRHCKMKDSLVHIFAILVGVLIVLLVTMYGPSHVHG